MTGLYQARRSKSYQGAVVAQAEKSDVWSPP